MERELLNWKGKFLKRKRIGRGWKSMIILQMSFHQLSIHLTKWLRYLEKIDEQWPVFIKNGTNKTNNAIDQVHSPDTDSLLWDSSIVGKYTLIITHTSQSMTQKLKRSRYLKTKFGKAMSCFLATIGQTKQIMKLTKCIPLMQTASFGTLFMWEKFPLIIRHTCQSMMQRLKEIQIS